MNIIRTLAGILALAFTAAAETQALNFLIEPGAFHPGNFSLPAPGKDHAAALRAKASNTENAVRMGLATYAEHMEAEQAALYAEMRCNTESARPAELRKLVSKSEELRQLRAQQAKNGMIPAAISCEADIKAAYYTTALQQDSASADTLLRAAEAYQQEMEKRFRSGLCSRVEVLLAEITLQEAHLLRSGGQNAEATQKKYEELAELLSARVRSGAAPAAPAEQAAEAARIFAKHRAEHRR